MTRRQLLSLCGLAVMLGVLLGWCVALPDPPTPVGLGEIPPEVTSTSTTSTSIEAPPAPGEGAWDALPSEDAVYLEALHQATTTTTEAPPPTREEPRDEQPEGAPTTVTTSPPAGMGPDYLHPFLVCTRYWESDRGPWPHTGGYRVVGGPHHGAYQFLPSTWDDTARRAGRPDLVGVLPSQASPADQDAMALALFARAGNDPWNGRC